MTSMASSPALVLKGYCLPTPSRGRITPPDVQPGARSRLSFLSFQRGNKTRALMTFDRQALFPCFEDLGSASNFIEEIQEIVKRLSLFEGFSNQESALLFDYMECYAAPSYSTILREGESGDFMIIILTGRINVVKDYAPGESNIVAELGPGGFLGEMSLFDGQQRFASCIATEPTDFAVLTRECLNDILVDHPRLGNKLLLILIQLITERLREASRRMLPTIIGVSL